ncbi:hypothetical protein BJ912DRAFT_1069063 [Pholiota molesta]|nr:hypothetical protein BJ912DRAFT_1069063 [Pholiota molesta]
MDGPASTNGGQQAWQMASQHETPAPSQDDGQGPGERTRGQRHRHPARTTANQDANQQHRRPARTTASGQRPGARSVDEGLGTPMASQDDSQQRRTDDGQRARRTASEDDDGQRAERTAGHEDDEQRPTAPTTDRMVRAMDGGGNGQRGRQPRTGGSKDEHLLVLSLLLSLFSLTPAHPSRENLKLALRAKYRTSSISPAPNPSHPALPDGGTGKRPLSRPTASAAPRASNAALFTYVRLQPQAPAARPPPSTAPYTSRYPFWDTRHIHPITRSPSHQLVSHGAPGTSSKSPAR